MEWYKLCALLPGALVTTLSRRSYAEMALHPHLARLFVQVMRETFGVMQALGMTVQDPPGSLWRFAEWLPAPDEVSLEGLRAIGERQRDAGERMLPSMLQDVLAGRLTEVEHLAGEVLRQAAALDLPVPATETCYRLIRGLEDAFPPGPLAALLPPRPRPAAGLTPLPPLPLRRPRPLLRVLPLPLHDPLLPLPGHGDHVLRRQLGPGGGEVGRRLDQGQAPDLGVAVDRARGQSRRAVRRRRGRRDAPPRGRRRSGRRRGQPLEGLESVPAPRLTVAQVERQIAPESPGAPRAPGAPGVPPTMVRALMKRSRTTSTSTSCPVSARVTWRNWL